MNDDRKIARERLDVWFLSGFFDLPSTFSRPARGWIGAIRYAIGMSGRQLAERLGISVASVSALEKREQEGSTTIKAMKRAAEAMDCTFFYGFRPNGSFEEIVRRRAKEVARRKIDRINQTMRLEGHKLPEEEIERIYSREVHRLVEQTPRFLWNLQSRVNRDTCAEKDPGEKKELRTKQEPPAGRET
jgi:predicted DNA-binding mobile mystery protein A